MTDTKRLEREHEQGEALGNILCMSKSRNERWSTAWGDKTSAGLYRTIIRLADQAREEVNGGSEDT